MARWREALRFHVPLIEPDVRIFRIRLAEGKIHAFARWQFPLWYTLPRGTKRGSPAMAATACPNGR